MANQNPYDPFGQRQFPNQPLPGNDGNYDTRGMFQNPAGTNPFPAPTNMPYSQWQSPATTLEWTTPESLDADFATAAYWQSPLFDLRPEIRGADGSRPSGIPMWGSISRKLWIQISGLRTVTNNVAATAQLYVVSREYAHIFDSTKIERVVADSDISADWASGVNQPNGIVLSFNPIGNGYPVRYWRCEIAFRRFDRHNPQLTVTAAFY